MSGNGLRLGGAFARTYYTLGEPFASLDANGNANIYSLFGVYPAIRSGRGNLDAQLSLDYLDLDDQVGTTQTFNRRWIRSFAMSLNADSRDDVLGGGVNAASVGYVNGYLQFRDEPAYLIDQATTQKPREASTSSSIRRCDCNTSPTRPSSTSRCRGSLPARTSTRRRSSCSVGPTACVPIPKGEGVGDDGFLGTAELRYTFPPWTWVTRPQAFVFFDGGTVRINQDAFRAGINRISQYGAGLGANLFFVGGFALRGSVAWRVGSEPVPGVSNAASQGWIQLVKFF